MKNCKHEHCTSYFVINTPELLVTGLKCAICNHIIGEFQIEFDELNILNILFKKTWKELTPSDLKKLSTLFKKGN